VPVISFRDFCFRYANLKEPTLKNINLNIEAGEKVLIAGPSGSGKSTLAHCINGLIPFTYNGKIDGTLEILGFTPYQKSIYEISQYVGTILQDQDGQFVGLSVGEDVAFAYENKAVRQDEMFEGVSRALQEVGMLDFIKETPGNLSGGQKQKISIAGILTNDTEILLFDEPLANLDPASGKRAMATIGNIHRQMKKTVIVIEHRIEDVLEHSFDRIVVINDGRIVADGHPDEILAANHLHEFGLREPLYIEALKRVKVKLTCQDKISDFTNILKYKDNVVQAYYQAHSKRIPAQRKDVLKVDAVCYRYFNDASYIIKDISFQIKQGEMLAVLGNNGAGKSTLLRVLSGIARQQKGTIEYMGQPIDDWSARKRSRIIGCVMQNPNQMITKQMIFDEIAFGLRNNGYNEEEVAERVEEVLRICGLYKYRKWPVDSLSYGQKKRVTIASILAMQPKIIILDEPTAGQDYRTYREFMGFLERIKDTGVSVVLITHDMHLALEYADRALVLSGGKIIAADSVFNVLSDSRVINQADLKETSIFKMAQLYEIEDVSAFTSFFVQQLKSGEIA
jgi:energy-coupling factor transporter ATP-binding protein EcfA2